MVNHPLVLAITGASGAVYAVRLLELLLLAGRHVELTISASASAVLKQELAPLESLGELLPNSLFNDTRARESDQSSWLGDV